MKSSYLALGLIALTIASTFFFEDSTLSEFQEWKAQYGPNWSPSQQAYRFIIFSKNLAEIQRHNADHSNTYVKGINRFTVLTQQEFAKTYLSPKPFNPEWLNPLQEQKIPTVGDVDWVSQGKVSRVKDQGNCGSCWAFSAIATLESFSLFKGASVDLSEQQLVDCSRSYGNQGCNGGYNYKGLAYVKDHGVSTSTQYPYTAKTQPCKPTSGSFKISSVVTTQGCTGLQNAIQSRPLGVSVDANNWSPYKSGIFNNCKTSLDHDVLLVGYTTTYWKIKNSWGTSWGENGFIRLAPGNTCGICIDKSPWPQ